ncbi:MAG TPA: ATP-binding cassette domain-containing protein [Streptosporangiaceae bacterium]|nr:ATP-binding cassette domain-containing protein [Streptosporangiaceae bacterium]
MSAELEIDDLAVRFGGLHALDGIAVGVEEGRTLGIIGPNGAGKTTLLNAICGLVRPARGEVRFRGQTLSGRKGEQIAALGVARTFQLAEGFGDFTVWDYVRLGMAAAGGARSGRRADHPCVASLQVIGLWPERARLLRSLPYGLRKLVDVCRATVSEPHLLLLDEPTSGLSAHERADMVVHLRTLKETIRTMLIVDHDVGFISAVSDQLYAIAYGKPLTQGPPEHVLAHPDVIAAYMG